MTATAALCLAGAAAGLAALTGAVLDRAGMGARLTDLAAAQDPALSAALLRSGVRSALLGVLGAAALLTVAAAAVAVLVLRRPRTTRWLLPATAVATVPVVALAQSVVTGGPEFDRLAFLLQAGLVVAALVPFHLRSSRTWRQSVTGAAQGSGQPVAPATPDAVRGATPPAPAPAGTPDSPPRAVRTSVALWWAGGFAGFLGVLATIVNFDAVQADLGADAIARDPSASTDVVALGVRITVWAVLGVWAVLVLASLRGTASLLHRRSWARWVLLGTGVVTLLLVDVAQDLVAGGTGLGRAGFLAQAVLVVLAMGFLVARSTRVWSRGSAG